MSYLLYLESVIFSNSSIGALVLLHDMWKNLPGFWQKYCVQVSICVLIPTMFIMSCSDVLLLKQSGDGLRVWMRPPGWHRVSSVSVSPGPRKWHQCLGLRQSADSVAIFGKNWKLFGFSCYCRDWACGRPTVTVQLKWTHKTLEAAMRPSHWPVTLRPRPLIGQCHLITRLYLSSLLSSLPLLRYSDLSRRLIFEKTVIICKSSPIRSIGQNSFFIL